MTLMVSARVKKGVPRGQILKLQKPYRVVSQMKALISAFQINKTFDAMTSFDDAMT
jgi:hypothetical protein